LAKLAMLFDLTKCAGCYGCVVACKMQNGTRPGINYNAVNVLEWGEYPKANQKFLSTLCMHCENPACVEICPTGASYKTENGTVLVDYEKCIGCGLCVNECPYEQRHLVEDDITSFPGVVAPYEEESVKRLKVVEKCTFCNERISEGLKPACVHNCPGKCRIFGDVEDPESEISKYIASHNAINIEGTSIYYVIPENMDRDLLPLAAVMSASASAKPAESKSSVGKYAVPAGIAVAGVAAVAVGVGISRKKSSKGGDNDNE